MNNVHVYYLFYIKITIYKSLCDLKNVRITYIL